MSYEHILFEEADGVATLTINRPQMLNALHTAVVGEMIHAVDRVRDEGTARALLLTGAGRAFCSGATSRAAIPPAPPLPTAVPSTRARCWRPISIRCSSGCSRYRCRS